MRISILKIFNHLGNMSGCHQIPERCFILRGYIFPICSRCTGVALGHLSAIILFLMSYRINIILSTIILLIMGLDWSLQYLNIKQSNNKRRFLTGFLGGFGLYNIYCFVLLKIMHSLGINIDFTSL